MAPTKGSCWFSGLLKPAGFNLRDCDRLDKPVGAGLQLCAVLSTPPMEVPAEGRVLSSSTKSANKPVKEPAKGPSIKAGRRREQESGPVAEGSPFGESSLPQHQEIDVSPAAAEEVTSPEGLVENSPQPRVRGPFEVQALIDSVKNEAPALSQTINTPPAAKIARMLGPLPKKEYCMYWIRRGECDYMQSGCRYKHEMPLDEETRQRIGLREIPVRTFRNCSSPFRSKI